MSEPIEYSVSVFSPNFEQEWNRFVATSRNGTFLHERPYMEYHKDRFPDSSLMIWARDQLIALLPATIYGDALYSHRGLTYGGLIVGRGFHARDAVPVFEKIVCWARENGLHRMIYKPVPHIYHQKPAEEDLYAITRLGGRLIRRDLSTSIKVSSSYAYSKGRKAALSKAKKDNLVVRDSDDYESFIAIETQHLKDKHGVSPVHTANEIALLAERFPKNIRLIAAFDYNKMLGGILVYITEMVCHAQYIGATIEGKRHNALDLCIDSVLSSLPENIAWFDFGISTTDEGQFLDEDLIGNKESWGGRSVVYDHYELSWQS